ncbi:DUF4384 domain-containing protein [bacterium]|nr:DUF4384 domain-containing protein [bacterium]
MTKWLQFYRQLPAALSIVVALTFVATASAFDQERNPDSENTEQAQDTGRFPGSALINSRPPFLVGVVVNHADGKYREGETLQISFMAEEKAYLYLLYHQADSQSLLLFPNAAAPDNLVAAGKPVRVPPDGLPPERQYRFRIQAPFGQEVLQVLAVRQPIAELNKLAAGSQKAASVDPALIEQLAKTLVSDPTMWTEHRVRIQTTSKDGRVRPEVRPERPTEPDRPQRPHGNPNRATPEAIASKRRLGLFIGIGQYQEPALAATHKELADSAHVMYDLMLKQGQLDAERTKLVLNEQATRASLEELFLKWLPSVSDPGDVVFIYFSGHAGQFPTDDPREPDGLDETLAPYDLTAGEEQLPVEQRRKLLRDSSILDDTLARWLEELSGRQVVLILDTCHSGGIVTSKRLRADSFLVDEAARVKDVSQMNTLILTSCAADEQSLFEGTPNGTMWFTYCLTEAISKREANRPLTVQAAFEHSARRMKELLLEGNADREQKPSMSDRILLPVALAP